MARHNPPLPMLLMVPVAKESRRVRLIFERAARGQTPAEIATRINHLKWRTKTWTARRSGKMRGGGKWTARQVLNLLRNPVYTGQHREAKSTRPGAHPPIVDQELFGQVQKILAGGDHRRRRDAAAGRRNVSLVADRGVWARGVLCARRGEACSVAPGHPRGHGREGSHRPRERGSPGLPPREPGGADGHPATSAHAKGQGHFRPGTDFTLQGLHWESFTKKWRAAIVYGGKTRWLGRFRDEVAAAVAYDEAAQLWFGEHARLNFPDGVDAWLEQQDAQRDTESPSCSELRAA